MGAKDRSHTRYGTYGSVRYPTDQDFGSGLDPYSTGPVDPDPGGQK